MSHTAKYSKDISNQRVSVISYCLRSMLNAVAIFIDVLITGRLFDDVNIENPNSKHVKTSKQIVGSASEIDLVVEQQNPMHRFRIIRAPPKFHKISPDYTYQGGDAFDFICSIIKYIQVNHWRTSPNTLTGYRILVHLNGHTGRSQFSQGIIVETSTPLEYSTVQYMVIFHIHRAQYLANRLSIAKEPFEVRYRKEKDWHQPDTVSEKNISEKISTPTIAAFWKIMSMIISSRSMLRPLTNMLVNLSASSWNQGPQMLNDTSSISSCLDIILDILKRPEYHIIWSDKDTVEAFAKYIKHGNYLLKSHEILKQPTTML